MKTFILLFALMLTNSWAKDYQLKDASAEYTVTHLVKTVKGSSKSLKGKMVCELTNCDYLVAIPVKSFVSSDSNRDLNMFTILNATKYPFVTIKGKVTENDLGQKQYSTKALVSLNGVEKEYPIQVTQDHGLSQGKVTILLEDHKVERPSLLTVAIKNEVPVEFSFRWVE